METNKSFGMVSSESKKDKRSVEVIQAEIRAKKKMKLAQEEEADEVIMPHWNELFKPLHWKNLEFTSLLGCKKVRSF